MIKRYKRILIILLIILNISFNTNATENKNILTIVEKESKTEYLENNQGYISKTIVDSNSDTGEVTVELKLSNMSKETEINRDTEIFLVVDNSGSMGYTTSTGEVRRNIIVRSMRNLVNNIYDNSLNVKVGLVRFANSGTLLKSSTALMCNLTDNKQTMLSAINEYENLDTSVTIDGVEMLHCEYGTNIEAGLKKANDNFSSGSKNKIMILLTDGIPTDSILYSTKSYVYNATKTRLKTIGDSGVLVISLMTGISEEDEEDAQEVIERIFGTTSTPTTGKFYNIADTDLESVVTNDILADVMEKIQNPINTTKIVDYFPKDITDNFEFSYVDNPSIGTVSEKIDSETNTIEWDIGTLKGNEVATLKYKLKLKDMNNEELLNKIISTNEKVVLSYNNTEDKSYEVILDSSPKVKLEEITDGQEDKEKEENNINSKTENGTNQKDNTLADRTLPNTGKVLIAWTMAIVAVSAVIAHIRYKKLYIK